MLYTTLITCVQSPPVVTSKSGCGCSEIREVPTASTVHFSILLILLENKALEWTGTIITRLALSYPFTVGTWLMGQLVVLTISPQSATFSPRTKKIPRGISPYSLPMWIRSIVPCKSKFPREKRKENKKVNAPLHWIQPLQHQPHHSVLPNKNCSRRILVVPKDYNGFN